ncbi:MAG: response regulator [Pseudomonadota bacterium]
MALPKALLAEDNRDDALFITRKLKDVATVHVATTKAEFERLLTDHKFDVILLDWEIPMMSGDQGIAIAEKLHPLTPIVIVSGSISHASARLACRASVVDFVIKGMEFERLDIAVKNANETAVLKRQAVRDNRLQLVGETTASYTHDLNQILQVFMGVGVLRDIITEDMGQPSERINRVLDAMDSSSRRGADMTKQLMTFVRGSNGSSMKAIAPEYLLTELRRMVSNFPELVEVTTKTLPGTSKVRCDTTQVGQVLLNLAVNSRDAMPHGGELHVLSQNATMNDTTLKGAYVVIEVRDTGTGIPEAALPHVFDAFWTSKAPGKGTGLGLFMARKIVNDHHGDIRVETSDKGTTFKIYLPVAVEETHTESMTRAEEFVGDGRTILIVDDELHMRMLVEMFLLDVGYRTLTASSGLEALSCFRSNQTIDVVLTDLGMPFMGGLELARALRGQRVDVPIVFLTGAMDAKDFDPMPDGVLTKPFSREQLLGMLKGVLTPAPV